MSSPCRFALFLAAAALPLAAAGPAAAQFSYVGHWEGALVRAGDVRVLRLELVATAAGLRASASTPDEPDSRRTLEPVVEEPGSLRLDLPGLDDVVLRPDTLLLELRGVAADDNGGEVLVRLKRVPPPAPAPAPVAEDLVARSGALRIAGTLTLPPEPGPHPVVVWIHGRSGTTRTRTMLIDYLARHGVGSFAYDRRGSGESTGDAGAATAADLTADAIAVVRTLAGHPSVDPARIGLHATSAGNWIAPRVALEAPAAFVINVVGPAVSVLEQQVAAWEVLLRTSPLGLTEAEVAQGLDYMRARLSAVLGGRSHDVHLRLAEALRGTRTGSAVLLPDDSEARDTSWLRRNDADPAPDLRRLRVPYLAFYGGADWIVPPERNVGPLRDHLAYAGNDDVTVVVIPRADHGLEAPASGSPYERLEDGRFERLSPTYVETMARWLVQRFVRGQLGAAAAPDSAAVRQAVRDYVEAIYLSDPERIRRSVDSTLVKLGHVEDDDAADGYTLRAMSFAQLLEVARTWNRDSRVDPARARKEVVVQHVLDRTASARLVAEWGVDFLHLHRVDGRWRIIHVLFQSHPPGTS